VSDQAAVDPGKPFAITETGYHTLTGSEGREGVDEMTQAKLLLDTYADAAQLGSKATDVYSLLDAYPDPSGTDQGAHYGLFRFDNSPKPAATAIHNLTSILQDSGPDSSSFSAGSLAYSVTGLPDTGHTELTEKSSGAFQVMIWNEPPVWDPRSDQPIANSSNSVTVDLGQNFQMVQVFDPLQSADAVQILHNVSALSLNLSDHLLVVQASGAQGASTMPAAQSAAADTFNFNAVTNSAPSALSPTELNSVSSSVIAAADVAGIPETDILQQSALMTVHDHALLL
jgi:hypothetical protein